MKIQSEYHYTIIDNKLICIGELTGNFTKLNTFNFNSKSICTICDNEGVYLILIK